MMSIEGMSQRRAGLGSSWVAHVLFSESTGALFHTYIFCIDFLGQPSVGIRLSSVKN